MSFAYKIKFSLNLANVFPEVAALTKGVNTHLSSMGYDEGLTLCGQPIKMTVTSEHELSDEQISKMKDMITKQLRKHFTGSNPVCESFRRQSELLVKQ